MRVNNKKREIGLKVVYYGPGLSGKTTNLKRLHRTAPEDNRGELVVLDTETERTLFFDYFPLTLGTVGGFRIKLDFFTVPGQSFYRRTRSLVLQGADGAVFVADSDPRREEANLVSLQDLKSTLALSKVDFDTFPLVFQWNKQDLPKALKPSILQRLLNPKGRPALSAIAATGDGVLETQEAIVGLVLNTIRQRPARKAM